MNDEQRHFLSLLSQPPARLTVDQAAWVLNCQAHDIPILVAARLLKPLGNLAGDLHTISWRLADPPRHAGER